jgi:hypothetical protein
MKIYLNCSVTNSICNRNLFNLMLLIEYSPTSGDNFSKSSIFNLQEGETIFYGLRAEDYSTETCNGGSCEK